MSSYIKNKRCANWNARNNSANVAAVLHSKIYAQDSEDDFWETFCLGENTCYCKEKKLKPKLFDRPKFYESDRRIKVVPTVERRRDCTCYVTNRRDDVTKVANQRTYRKKHRSDDVTKTAHSDIDDVTRNGATKNIRFDTNKSKPCVATDDVTKFRSSRNRRCHDVTDDTRVRIHGKKCCVNRKRDVSDTGSDVISYGKQSDRLDDVTRNKCGLHGTRKNIRFDTCVGADDVTKCECSRYRTCNDVTDDVCVTKCQIHDIYRTGNETCCKKCCVNRKRDVSDNDSYADSEATENDKMSPGYDRFRTNFDGNKNSRTSSAEGLTSDTQRLNDFRNDHYFETHSVQDLIKNIPPHKCVHQFELDDRILPVPVNSDDYGVSRCIICEKPMENPKVTAIDERLKCQNNGLLPKFYKYGLAPRKVFMGGEDVEIDMVVDDRIRKQPWCGKLQKPNYCDTYALKYQKGVY